MENADVSHEDSQHYCCYKPLISCGNYPDRGGFGKTDKYSLGLGYRYMRIDIEESERDVMIETDLTMTGPFVGFVIAW